MTADARTHDAMPQTWRLSSLALEHVYDAVMQQVYPAVDVAIVASSAFHARQLCSRCGAVSILPTCEWYTPEQQPYFKPHQIRSPEIAMRWSHIIWAAPTADDAPAWMRHIDNILAHDGVLHVIVGGGLAFRLPERGLTGRAISGRRAARLLRENGYVVRQSVAFHGIGSYAAGLMSILTAKLGQPDIADRWEFQMRARYTVRSGTHPFSTVGLLTAQRK